MATLVVVVIEKSQPVVVVGYQPFKELRPVVIPYDQQETKTYKI